MKTSNIFAENKELIKFLKLPNQTKIQGYFINSPTIAESPRQRLFLREQMVIISHLKGRNKLLLVATIIPPSYNTQVIKQFTEKLENVGWFTEEHNLTYTRTCTCTCTCTCTWALRCGAERRALAGAQREGAGRKGGEAHGSGSSCDAPGPRTRPSR